MTKTAIILGGLGHEKQEGFMDKGYSFHVRVMWWIVIALCMALMLSYLTGCGFNSMFGEKFNTRVVGAQVAVQDNTTDQKGAEVKANRGIEIEVTGPASVAGVTTRPSHPIPVEIDQPIVIGLGDKSIQAPAGSTVRVRVNNEHESVAPTFSHLRTATAQGATLYSQEAGRGNFDASAPNVALTAKGGATADGGDTGISWLSGVIQAMGASSWIAKALGGIGIAALVVGGAWLIFNKVVGNVTGNALPILVAVAGVLFISMAVVVDKYPVVCLLIVLAGVGAVVLYVMNQRRQKALTRVVDAVEQSPDGVAAAVKENVAASDHDGVAKSLVSAIKKQVEKIRPIRRNPHGAAQATTATPPAPAVFVSASGVASPRVEETGSD